MARDSGVFIVAWDERERADVFCAFLPHQKVGLADTGSKV